MPKQFSRVVIAGVGLIGGSFALALKSAGVVNQVVGIGRTRVALDNAKQLGVIDVVAENWVDALRDADLVLLSMPVGQMENSLRELMPHLEPKTLITDAGSTKSDIVAAARAALGKKIGQFIPAHPIAGGEKSGADAATATLYNDRRVVLTPLAENSPDDVEAIREVWQHCGARVSELAPETHDRIFAAVSHLPHLLAFALVDEFTSRANADELFSFAAGGFRDFTRIASSHPEMWRDICLANRPALLAELDAYMVQLMHVRVLLANADAVGLEAMFTTARKRRDEWLESKSSASG